MKPVPPPRAVGGPLQPRRSYQTCNQNRPKRSNIRGTVAGLIRKIRTLIVVNEKFNIQEENKECTANFFIEGHSLYNVKLVRLYKVIDYCKFVVQCTIVIIAIFIRHNL
jgi:hypothetical protein